MVKRELNDELDNGWIEESNCTIGKYGK